MRLLVAEDDPKLLKTLTRLFELNRYPVDGVSNGNDAFDYAVTGEYDGLVLDIMMPGLDGITVLKNLRQKGITTPALFGRRKQRPISALRAWTRARTIIFCKAVFNLRIAGARACYATPEG